MTQAATPKQINDLLGRSVPAEALDVESYTEAGIDRLLLLRLTLPDADAATFADQLLGAAPVAGVDPYLSSRADLPWWRPRADAGSAGGERRRTDRNLYVKLLVSPVEAGRRTIWVEAFTQ